MSAMWVAAELTDRYIRNYLNVPYSHLSRDDLIGLDLISHFVLALSFDQY